MHKGVGMIAVLTMILAAGVLTLPAEARHPGEGGHSTLEDKFFKKAHMIFSEQDTLGVTDEQLDQIKTLKNKTKKELIMTKAKIDIIKVEIKANLYEDVIDTKAVNQLIDQKYELKKAKAKTLVGAFATLKSILTDQQRDTLKDLWREKNKEKMSHH